MDFAKLIILNLLLLLSCNSGDKSKEEEKDPDPIVPPVDVSGTFLTSGLIEVPGQNSKNYILGISLFCDKSSRTPCDISTLDKTLGVVA